LTTALGVLATILLGTGAVNAYAGYKKRKEDLGNTDVKDIMNELSAEKDYGSLVNYRPMLTVK
jgi:hypothetical protein